MILDFGLLRSRHDRSCMNAIVPIVPINIVQEHRITPCNSVHARSVVSQQPKELQLNLPIGHVLSQCIPNHTNYNISVGRLWRRRIPSIRIYVVDINARVLPA